MNELLVPGRPPDSRRRRFGTTWWGAAWLAALEQQANLDPNRLPRGRTYARQGAVGDTVIRPGEARAPVFGSRPEPYRVVVRVEKFDTAGWERVLDAIGGSVGHTAALLDGELPPEVTEDVERAGLSLLPGTDEVSVRCSCPDWAVPCKHAAALCYVLAEVLDADPFAVLLLRGRGRDEVLAALRARRAAARPAATVGRTGPVPASLAYQRQRPALPAPLPPPDRPGIPVPLPDHEARADVTALALDAADRAARLLVPGAGVDVAGLNLDAAADLARRGAARLEAGETLDAAAYERAAAWRTGGAGGLAALTEVWSPAPSELAPGRAELDRDGAGAPARVWRNRITRDDRQLRLGRDGHWYPYRRARGDRWTPAAPPVDPTAWAADPEDDEPAQTAR